MLVTPPNPPARWQQGCRTMAMFTAAVWAAASVAAPPLVGADGSLGGQWRFVGLPNQTLPPTRYSVESAAGRVALRIEAERSYGSWVHTPATAISATALRWSWRVERPNDRTDLATKEGDDAAARVCLGFDLPLAQLPFFERQKLLIARAVSGIELAAATLCYVWGGREARGSLLVSPYTRRVRQIVLRGADDAGGAWLDEQRDLGADFLRAFGDETGVLPPVTTLIVGADADNTLARSVAHLADLRLTLRARSAKERP